MKYYLRLLVMAVATTASAWAYAPHPSYLTTKYKKEMLPVVKVIGTDPVVIVNGKEKRIRIEPIYLVRRAPGYSEATIDIVSQTMTTLETKMVASEGDAAGVIHESQGGRFGRATFEYVFRAREDFPGGFAVVMIYSPTLLKSNARHSNPEIVVHDLPAMAAGASTSVDFGSAIPDGRPNQKFFTQVFDSQGREVFTNRTRDSWMFYSIMEQKQLKSALPQYREKFAGADQSVTPVLMPRPVLTPGMTLPAESVTATLTISAEGLVTEVELPELADRKLHHETVAALKGWLFFPQLKQGEPVASKAMVPINF